MLKEVAQRGCGCPVAWSVAGQIGCVPGQFDLGLDLGAGSPASGKGVGI